jgi:succinyl-CoA:acetate CoA-transferase
MTDRLHMRATSLLAKVMSADSDAALIQPGAHIGMSGFTGAGDPKAVPAALVRRSQTQPPAGSTCCKCCDPARWAWPLRPRSP